MAEKKYIECEAVSKEIEEKKNLFSPIVRPIFDVCKFIISEASAADVVEVVHGEWTGCDGDNCSVCGRSPSEIMDADSYYAIGFNINDLVACPFCGAKMDEKGDAE